MSRWNPIDKAKVARDLERTGSLARTAKRFGVSRERIRQIAGEMRLKKSFIAPTTFRLTNTSEQV